MSIKNDNDNRHVANCLSGKFVLDHIGNDIIKQKKRSKDDQMISRSGLNGIDLLEIGIGIMISCSIKATGK